MAETEKGRSRKRMAASIVAASKENGRFLEARNGEKAARCLEKLAEGRPFKTIIREEGVDWHALVNLRARHRALIDERREMVAQDALALVEGVRLLQQEKMKLLAEDENALKRVNLRDLAMSYGIYTEKYFMASEGNRVVIEHKSGAPSLEDAVKAIEAAKAKLRAASIETVVTPVVEAVPPVEVAEVKP